jgi:hypothetical protein
MRRDVAVAVAAINTKKDRAKEGLLKLLASCCKQVAKTTKSIIRSAERKRINDMHDQQRVTEKRKRTLTRKERNKRDYKKRKQEEEENTKHCMLTDEARKELQAALFAKTMRGVEQRRKLLNK